VTARLVLAGDVSSVPCADKRKSPARGGQPAGRFAYKSGASRRRYGKTSGEPKNVPRTGDSGKFARPPPGGAAWLHRSEDL